MLGAVGSEADLPVGQIKRLAVVHGSKSELAKVRAVGVDLVNVIARLAAALVGAVAEGEEELLSVPVETDVAINALAQRVGDRRHLPLGRDRREAIDPAAG